MGEDGVSHESTPLAADDMIGSLAAQVRELSLRVAQLEGELEAARRRVAVYENFDAQVQDSLSAALRAANQIRERARVTAEAIAEEARAQRPESAAELEAMRIERDTLRRAIEEATRSAPARPAQAATPTFPMSEMRMAAAEALRGVFKELVTEIRSMPAAQARPQPAPEAPAVQPPSSPAAPPAAAAPPQPTDAPPVPAPEALRPTIVPPEAPTSEVVEDIDIAPESASTAAEPAQDRWTPTPSEPIGELQVVLSPISSFPRLVELERRLQGMPVVRTVYARDFRNGVATLAIGLRHPMTVDEFATAVTKLEYPMLRIVSTSGYVLELRIDTEASSIA